MPDHDIDDFLGSLLPEELCYISTPEQKWSTTPCMVGPVKDELGDLLVDELDDWGRVLPPSQTTDTVAKFEPEVSSSADPLRGLRGKTFPAFSVSHQRAIQEFLQESLQWPASQITKLTKQCTSRR